MFGLHDLYAGYYKIVYIYFIPTVISFLIYSVFLIVIWCIAILEIILSVKDANGNKLK